MKTNTPVILLIDDDPIFKVTANFFLKKAFNEVGIQLDFVGKGVNEKAFVVCCHYDVFQIEIGKEVLSVDPTYFRPTEVDLLIGDPTKAKTKLRWVPEHDLASLVKDMMQSDVKLMQKKKYLENGGYQTNTYFD